MAVTIELVVGEEGSQKGCVAVIVRTEEHLTQTPWLILSEREGGKIAREILAKLRAEYPAEEIVAIGFDYWAAKGGRV